MRYGVANKIDTAYMDEKIAIRIDAISQINKPVIQVLDAFGGEGLIWKAVREQLPSKQIHSLRIDKRRDLDGIYLKGDNIKFLGSKDLDLATFDIIDLDAYGSPFNQLEVVFKRRYIGIVVCTYIQIGISNINVKMLEKIGYTNAMIKKAPNLFSRQPFKKMLQYLRLNGIDEITNIRAMDRNEKNYFYFVTKKPKS